MATESMIERVARAMCRAEVRAIDPDEPIFGGQKAWEARADMARAAIEAMREPTEGMVDAAREKRWVGADTDGLGIDFDPPPEVAWKAMIDAALKTEA